VKRVSLGLVALVLIAGVVTALIGHLVPSEPVYSVVAVQDGVRQHPKAWVGRTVRVRGWVGATWRYTWCAAACQSDGAFDLTDTNNHAFSSSIGTTLYSIPARGSPRTVPGSARVTAIRALAQAHATPLAPMVAAAAAAGVGTVRVLLPPGVQPLSARPQRTLPDTFYALPLVGPALVQLYPPGDARVTVRLRLLPCATNTTTSCVGGVLVGP